MTVSSRTRSLELTPTVPADRDLICALHVSGVAQDVHLAGITAADLVRALDAEIDQHETELADGYPAMRQLTVWARGVRIGRVVVDGIGSAAAVVEMRLLAPYRSCEMTAQVLAKAVNAAVSTVAPDDVQLSAWSHRTTAVSAGAV